MDAQGKLPPKPTGHDDILDHLEFSVDPQLSLHAMRNMLLGIGRVFDQVGIGALHNMTDIPFLTSDNPVVWFDPSVPEAKMRPYVLQGGGPVVLLFPADSVSDDLWPFIHARTIRILRVWARRLI